MKYRDRKQQEYDRVLSTIMRFIPFPLWRLKFITSWAERLADNIASQNIDATKVRVEEAWYNGWKQRKEQEIATSYHVRNQMMPGMFRSKLYLKDQGWVE